MDKGEFNLSVLENAADFSSSLNDSANYETIVSLIKEEIDINTEDETEPLKVTKQVSPVAKISECVDSDGVFKSPYKRYSLPRAKTSSGKKRRTRAFQRNEQTMDRNETRRARSLGAVKPGRTGKRRRNCSSASQSSDTSSPSDWADSSVSEAIDVPVDQDEESRKKHGAMGAGLAESPAGAESCPEEGTVDGTKGDHSITESGMKELSTRPSRVSLSPGKNDNFVESTQNTTISTMRRKLTNNRESAPGASLNGKDVTNSYAESDEEEGQNFSLTFSPTSKSQTSNPDSSVTPQRLGKRRGSATGLVESSTLKLRKTDSLTSTKTPSEQSGSAVPSPFKVLTQEMENCITSSDYEQMSEDLQSDTLNRASFTFETIELLNEYEDSNERVNNRILSKIFSSPSSTKVKEEPPDALDPVAPCEEQFVEDPLRIEENERISGVSCSKARKSKNGKPTVPKTSAKVGQRRANESSIQDTSETNENVAPASFGENKSAATRTSEAKKSMPSKKRSGRKSLEIKTGLNENIPTSAAREPTAKETEKLVGETKLGEKERRHSARLAVKTPVKMELSDLEDDVDLAVEAANVSRRIEEAARRMATAEKTLAKLKDIVIRVRHEVLPQHKIESRAGSKALTYAQQKQFLRFAPLSKTTYSPAEDEIIRSNWNAFCQDHDWNPKNYKPFLKLKHGDQLIMTSLEKRRLFVQFLANGLPNRPLCSVYSRFKTLYEKHSNAGARYTSEEDMQIFAYMLHKPADNPDNKCSELAKLLDRTRESISKRYKKLMQKYCDDNDKKVLTKVEWNLSLAGEFISTLLDVTFSKNTMELKDAFIPKVVWLKMEEKMKIDHQLLKRFWEQQLHLQLFADEPLYLNRIKVLLIEHMYAKQIWHPTDIKWQHIVQSFDGLTISFLRKIFNHLTMKTSTKIRTRNFKKILDWLYTKKIEELLSGPRDKCLPRIFYKDKKARIRKEDVDRLQSCSESSDTNELQV